MDLFPAVDIRGGRVTHVRTGATSVPSVYGDDPAAAVERLGVLGARWVHLVDLDRAYGTGSNRDVMRALLGGTRLRVQIGGSLGQEDALDEMLAWGAARVVVGCGAAARDPALAGRLIRRHGVERVAVGVDATQGLVTPRGGEAAAPVPAEDLAGRVRDQGARTVIYTDVTRDGTLTGPDIDGARRVSQMGLEVVVSGGVGTLADIGAVRDARLAGAIVGRALHEGRFTLAEALACAV